MWEGRRTVYTAHTPTVPSSHRHVDGLMLVKESLHTHARTHSRPCSLSIGLMSGVVVAGRAQTWLTQPPGLRVTLRSH